MDQLEELKLLLSNEDNKKISFYSLFGIDVIIESNGKILVNLKNINNEILKLLINCFIKYEYFMYCINNKQYYCTYSKQHKFYKNMFDLVSYSYELRFYYHNEFLENQNKFYTEFLVNENFKIDEINHNNDINTFISESENLIIKIENLSNHVFTKFKIYNKNNSILLFCPSDEVLKTLIEFIIVKNSDIIYIDGNQTINIEDNNLYVIINKLIAASSELKYYYHNKFFNDSNYLNYIFSKENFNYHYLIIDMFFKNYNILSPENIEFFNYNIISLLIKAKNYIIEFLDYLMSNNILYYSHIIKLLPINTERYSYNIITIADKLIEFIEFNHINGVKIDCDYNCIIFDYNPVEKTIYFKQYQFDYIFNKNNRYLLDYLQMNIGNNKILNQINIENVINSYFEYMLYKSIIVIYELCINNFKIYNYRDLIVTKINNIINCFDVRRDVSDFIEICHYFNIESTKNINYFNIYKNIRHMPPIDKNPNNFIDKLLYVYKNFRFSYIKSNNDIFSNKLLNFIIYCFENSEYSKNNTLINEDFIDKKLVSLLFKKTGKEGRELILNKFNLNLLDFSADHITNRLTEENKLFLTSIIVPKTKNANSRI